jgi:hypothetical protein
MPEEVITDLAPALESAIEELIPDAFHNTEMHANNRVECDHGRLKSRLRPMRGLKTVRTPNFPRPGHRTTQQCPTDSITWPVACVPPATDAGSMLAPVSTGSEGGGGV